MSCSIGIALGWASIAVLLALQAYFIALWRQEYQPWWPSFGYALAIFSIWALLTPTVLNAAEKVHAARLKRGVKTALWVLGWPLTTALHVLVFVVLYWPVYGGKFATPLEMAEPVFMANVDKSAIAYLALAAFVYHRRHMSARAMVSSRPGNGSAEDEGLWIRMAGCR